MIVYTIHGKWEKALASNGVHLTNYLVSTGLGNIIRDKQKTLGVKKDELLLMIKPLESSSYNSLMNALDEVMINEVKKYAIMNAATAETLYVKE